MKTGCKLANRNTMGAVMIDILILLLTTLFCIHFIDVYELIKNIKLPVYYILVRFATRKPEKPKGNPSKSKRKPDNINEKKSLTES